MARKSRLKFLIIINFRNSSTISVTASSRLEIVYIREIGIITSNPNELRVINWILQSCPKGATDIYSMANISLFSAFIKILLNLVVFPSVLQNKKWTNLDLLADGEIRTQLSVEEIKWFSKTNLAAFGKHNPAF